MDQRQVFLRDVLLVLFKRKILIVLFAAVVFVATFLGNYAWPPTYESMAKVRLIKGREQVSTDVYVTKSPEKATSVLQMTKEDVYSEMELVYSEDVLTRVVEKRDLASKSLGAPGVLRGALRAVRGTMNQVLYALQLLERPSAEQAAIEGLRRAIEVKPVENTYVLEIRCRLGDPELAQQVLDTLIEEFTTAHIAVFSEDDPTKKSSTFFDSQLDRNRAVWEEAQESLKTFKNDNSVLDVDEEKKLINERYAKAKRLQLQLKALEDIAQEGVGPESGGDSAVMTTLSRETESTVITEIRLKLLEKVSRRHELATSKGERHPDVQSVNHEIETGWDNLKQALALVTQTVSDEIEQLEVRLKEINNLMATIERLEMDVQIAADAVEYYAQKVEESKVAEAIAEKGISSIRMVSSPSLPLNPVRPRKLFNLLMALVGGIVGGFALAFFLEWLDHGLKVPEDVEHFLKVPPVASFFQSPFETLDPKEAQRLSTMLDAVHTDETAQLIEVASSVGSEGSIRVARALAEAYAEDQNKATLLVDFMGDGLQDTPSGEGLMDVIEGQCRVEDVIASLGNLFILGRGSARECPSYLWNSQAVHDVLAELRSRFPRIIFHVPPVLQSHDALNLARNADGMLIVIRADNTRREVVMRALDMVKGANGKVLGAVLTDRKQVIPGPIYRRI
jgi:polysaccharide biosynthesis transport protein